MDAADESGKVVDSNGNELFDGDDVTVIKDLKVKGSSMVVKRGTRVRGIRLSEEDPTHVQGRVDGQTIFILTEFLKK
jgi:protein PhnA